MTEKYCCLFVPLDQLDTARALGAPDWNMPRAITTDSSQAPPATHYGSAGVGDADKADAIAALPGVFYSEQPWPTALADAGLYTVVFPDDM